MLHEKRLLAANKALQGEIEERKVSEAKIKLLNAQLVANNAHLKSVNEELDRFAYVASHDLQEPLRKIMVFSDKILLHATQEEETQKYFRKIITSSQRMQSLINDLLSFSRHTMSASDFKRIDLNEQVQLAIGELEIEVERSKARIEIDKLPVIWGVPTLIRQLFYNLLSNAIKFCRKGDSPLIRIHSTKMKAKSLSQYLPSSAEGNYYRITIADSGIGFDAKYAKDIFIVFKRLNSYHDFEGSGVGLSICKKIVEKHDGFISANSELGKGSTFVIGLPDVK
jgi:light-regulated signal transduction histidine kinase (bacteriophytochrome)